MTGYGKAEAVLETGKLTIEIKTLNGKNSDANIKSSLLPKDKELLVRRKITDSLVRGTIDFYITWEPKAGGMAKQINKELLRCSFHPFITRMSEDYKKTQNCPLSFCANSR